MLIVGTLIRTEDKYYPYRGKTLPASGRVFFVSIDNFPVFRHNTLLVAAWKAGKKQLNN